MATTRSSERITPCAGQLGQRGDGHAAGRLGEDALGPGQKPDALEHLVVGDRRA